MRALILGIGDAFTRRYFSCSALVEAPRGHVLIDCPDLIHRVLHESTHAAGWSADAGSIDDIILTHLHGDHCNGLESFAFFRRHLHIEDPTRPRPRLHTSAAVIDRLWSRLAPAMDAPYEGGRPSRLDDYFELHTIEPGNEYDIAGLCVSARFTQHPIPTTGLLLRDGPHVIGWSSDTPFEQAHVDWLATATIIIHESNRGAAHTPIEQLEALPAAVRQRMRLIHLPDDFDPSRTTIRVLQQGEVIEP
jgi:phosphoribosyl 1,2-cyclic phosphodiesterase